MLYTLLSTILILTYEELSEAFLHQRTPRRLSHQSILSEYKISLAGGICSQTLCPDKPHQIQSCLGA